MTIPSDPEHDRRARELLRSANTLVPQGKWAEAADALEQAAALHAEAGRSYDEGRCLQFAATLRRASGDPAQALLLARKAAALAPADTPLAVSVAAEQAEAAQTEYRFADAVALWTQTLERGEKAGLKPDGVSAVLRRRAAALVVIGALEEATRDFDHAHRLIETQHGRDTAGFVRTEQSTVLWRHGHVAEAERALSPLEGQPVSRHLESEILLMRARLQRAAGRDREAADCARRACAAAREAVAPLIYFAAGAELADAQEALGDRTGAYGTLAATWATLSDLLGDELAASWVEPCLLACKLLWGEEAFGRAKGEYEAWRRSQLHREAS